MSGEHPVETRPEWSARIGDGPMRVALISSSFDPHLGGVEEHTRHLAANLARLGHAVEVWTVDRGEHLGVRTVDGVTVRYLPTPLPARSSRAATTFVRSLAPAWNQWTLAHRRFRPDVLNVQCFGPNGLYALALHRRHGTPLVISSHGETFADDHQVFDRSRLLRGGLRRAAVTAASVTGCSQVVADDLARRFGVADTVIVPNAIDLGGDGRSPARPPYDPARPTVFAVGRVEYVKGFDLLIRAFSRMRLSSDSQLVVGGDGSQLPHLRALAEDLGVAGRVVFPGRLTGDEVAGAMAAAAVVAVPSRMEAFGIVVLEAWRSGRPLVASRRGGPGSLVTDGVDGVLVDPDDTASFASALTRVVQDPELAARLGSSGRETVRGFGWDRVVEQYLGVYRRAIAG